jgi:hypothetical protein
VPETSFAIFPYEPANRLHFPSRLIGDPTDSHFCQTKARSQRSAELGRIEIARPFGLDNARLWMSTLREAFRLDYPQPQNLMPLVRGQGLSSWLPACFSAVVARPDYIAEEAFDETDFLK